MHLQPLFQVLLAPLAVTVVSAACTRRPCGPDAIIRILTNPELAEPASSFCSAYNQPTTTESVTATATQTVFLSQTAPAETITTTELQTITTVITEYTTSYSTVAASSVTLVPREAASIDFGPLTALSRFPASRISSACSCLVATPSPATTVTSTATATNAAAASTIVVTIPSDETVTITVTETTTESQTTTIQTTIPTQVPVDACAGNAGRKLSLCCPSVVPWISNSAIWGGICSYYPNSPAELVGGRCISRPSSGCPTGTRATCCEGFVLGVPNICSLGTNCLA